MKARSRPSAASEANPYKKAIDVQQADDFMSSLLGGLDSKPAAAKSTLSASVGSNSSAFSRKRKVLPQDEIAASLRNSTASSFMSGRKTSTSSSSNLPTSDELHATGPSSEGSDGLDRSYKRPRQDEQFTAPVLNAFDDMDFNDGGGGGMEMDLDWDDPTVKANPTTVTAKAEPNDDDDFSIKPLQSRDSNANPQARPGGRRPPSQRRFGQGRQSGTHSH